MAKMLVITILIMTLTCLCRKRRRPTPASAPVGPIRRWDHIVDEYYDGTESSRNESGIYTTSFSQDDPEYEYSDYYEENKETHNQEYYENYDGDEYYDDGM